MTTPSSRTAAARKAIGSGRGGQVRAGLRRVLDEARQAHRMTLEHELRGLMADKLAACIDDYARDGEREQMRRAIKDLTELMDTLPIRAIRGGEETPDDGAPVDEGSALRLVLDSPPTVGDSAHA